MTAEARTLHDTGELQLTAASTISSGEVRQLPDGRAGVRAGLNSIVSGQQVGFMTDGVFSLTKSTSIVFLPGQEIWWDPSNNYATHQVAGRAAGGFFVGLCVDADTVAAATTRVTVELNKRRDRNLIDVQRDGGITVLTGSSIAKDLAGGVELALIATNEAECADLLSYTSVAVSGDPILEGEIVVVAAAGSATDISFGLANGTSTTDADAITESLFIHIDGASANILAESDDGTTEVAATDTTVDWTANTPFLVQFDVRDPASCKIYVNGARVLSATTFVLTAATGPLKVLLHAEKSSSTNTAQVRFHNVRLYRSLAA